MLFGGGKNEKGFDRGGKVGYNEWCSVSEYWLFGVWSVVSVIGYQLFGDGGGRVFKWER
ncbi:MAG: hypothetical protein JXD22_05340 [Sedimentisphaerales bacterium]|nr:hypothetical protein [Sedimentisphaerales bacterium]